MSKMLKTQTLQNNKYPTKVYGYTSDPKDTRDFLNLEILNITLRLSDKCNFSCKYCSYYDNTKKHIKFETLKEILNTLMEVSTYPDIPPYKKINWYIHGGEPTVYPHFVEAMLHILNSNKIENEIEVQTNSSFKNLNKFKPFIGKNIKFVCSYQNHQNNPEQFKKFCSFLLENNLFAGTDLILENFGTENEQENIIEIYDWLIEQKYKYNLPFNVQTNTVDGISLDTLPNIYKERFSNKKHSELIKVEYNDGSEDIHDYDTFTSTGKNTFKLMKCNVGLQSIIVDTTEPEIKLYKCFSDILYDKQKPYLKLKPEEFNIQRIKNIFKQTICIHPKCICEIFIPKSSMKNKVKQCI